jgi:hypothetical protein
MFRAMSPKKLWRFCLQITDGPNSGLGAGPWRLWVHRDDIYLAATGQEDTIKVSLHESGKWRVAYTAEHMAGEHLLWSRTADRAAWKFAAPPFIDGVQEAFVVATVRAALTRVELDGRESVVAIEDRWDVWWSLLFARRCAGRARSRLAETGPSTVSRGSAAQQNRTLTPQTARSCRCERAVRATSRRLTVRFPGRLGLGRCGS